MKRKILSMFAVIMVLSFGLVSPSMAQTCKTTFVSLGTGVPGLLYEPVSPGPKAEIGVVAMHNRSDYLTAHASNPCIQLATRGYRALCANTSTSKSGFVADDDIDKMILNVKSAVA
jgi:dienelactone hydrolase